MPAETLMNSSPMDRSEIVTLVRERLAEILEIEPSAINEGDSFSDDLEADSLALIEATRSTTSTAGQTADFGRWPEPTVGIDRLSIR